MKKLFLILCILLMSGCNISNNNTSEAEITEENSAAPNIMVNGRLYHTTGELYDGRFYIEAMEEDYNQQFEVNGTITSSVEGYELPHENDQSNFGIGYEYHIVDAENVLVRIEGLWIRYECANSMKNVPRNPADSSAGGIGTVPFLCIDCVCIVLQFLCSYCLRFLHDICIFMCISDTVFELVYLIKYGYENNEAIHISHRSMCPSISIRQTETDHP